MSLGLARGRPLIPLGNPARDTRRPKCWKSQHFGRLVSGIILLCILLDWLLDWFGHMGWGYPWYSPIAVGAQIGVAICIRRFAKGWLRSLG
jgi:hypothetical protein